MISRVSKPLGKLLRACRDEANAGLLLFAVAALAMVAANSPWAPIWHAVWHAPLPWSPLAALPTAAHWIEDALMAVFFFTVGLEIKREALVGSLAGPHRRRLPVLAAGLGMALPALVYLVVVRGHAGLVRGWAIPAATDIAFALGVLGIVARRLPMAIRLFLLAIAVVDDLGAVAIIALFYGGPVHTAWLAAAAVSFAILVALNRRCTRAWPFVAGAVLLWICVLHSGVHATVAGVLAALTIPLRRDTAGTSLLLRLEHALAPWCSSLIVPLFGLASAGVPLAPGSFGLLTLAVAAGLALGKPAGVLGATWLAGRTGFARPPVTGAPLRGVAMLAGIGFTMSLFIANLAFAADPRLADQARLGVLSGSLLSALSGAAVLAIARRRSP